MRALAYRIRNRSVLSMLAFLSTLPLIYRTGTGAVDTVVVVVTFSVVVFAEASAVVPVGIGMVFHSVVLLSVVVVGSVVGTVIYGGRVTVVTGVVFVATSVVVTILLVLLSVVYSTIVVVLAVVVEAGVSSGSA